MIKTVQQVVRERLNECAHAAFMRFRYAVVPIYGSTDRGAAVHIGSGILLRLSEGHCLLTAAHIIDKNKETTLYTGTSRAEELLLDFVITMPSRNRDRASDHGDFALALLPPHLVQRLDRGFFVEECEISQSVATPVGKAYTCLGFPNSKNKTSRRPTRNLQPVLGTYTGIGLAHQRLPSVASAEDHILVDCNWKYSRDENGRRVNTIPIRGFSGGAIVDVGRPSDPGTLDKDCRPLLAGMIIEAHEEERAILGVRIATILARVRAAKGF